MTQSFGRIGWLNQIISGFFYLNNNLVQFPEKIRTVIEHVLCFAVTSSDAERAFSVMTALKTKDRSSMSDDLLNALMWFKMNVAKLS